MVKMELWKVSDELWEKAEPLIPQPKRDPSKEYKRKSGGGRKPLPKKNVFEAILYIMRMRIQWKALPQEYFGCSGSTAHRTFQHWQKANFFKELCEKGLNTYEELSGIKWEWQSADGSMIKTPIGLEAMGANPTNRDKSWVLGPCPDGWNWCPAVTHRNRSKLSRRG